MSTGPFLSQPCAANAYQGAHIARLAASFARITGGNLYAEAGLDPASPGLSAWNGGFALLSHRGDAEATLNYGNELVLRLWDCDWAQLTAMPSAATAPPDDRTERAAQMEKVARDGFVRGYSGRRISRAGRLFVIENATVWRLIDEAGDSFGVAAWIPRHRFL